MEVDKESRIVDLSKKRKLKPEFFDLPTPKHTCFAKATDEAIGSDHKSAEGSNSFIDDTASSSMSSENRMYSSGSVEADDMGIRTEDDINSLPSDGPINLRQILEEQILEFKARSHHIEDDDAMEQSGDNETDDNILNILDIDRETPANTKRKPTTDKEFEQYFSMLML